MALRQDRDRAKAQQEKFQAILLAMLRDEDNKYCEDCDAKGPRWASWNLGIFLCIRCAGIHRNLGVHISRVKSVNLDSWTAEQVAMMQEMGNSRARAVYEANVPDDFRRPQTNSAMEALIRAKYEDKKYIAREFVPPKPVVPKEWFEDDTTEKKKPRSKPTPSASSNSLNQQSVACSTRSVERRHSAAKLAAAKAADPKPAPPQPVKASSGADDLLGLELSVNQTSNTEIAPGPGGQDGDLLSDLFGASQSQSVSAAQGTQPSTEVTQQNGFVQPSFFEKEGGGGGGGEQGEKKSTKDSIMALYGSGGMQQQMFGVPGLATMTRPHDGKGRSPSAWATNPFLYPEASYYQTCYVASSPYYYSTAGGVYMPQQQMYGTAAMPSMTQQQQVMMGMQPGMMGQPMQQGMVGLPQQSGVMYGTQMGNGMMGGGQGMMANGAGFMQPQVSQSTMAQQFNPMQQVAQSTMAQQFNPMQQQQVSQSTMAQQFSPMQPQVSQSTMAQQFNPMQQQVSQPAMAQQFNSVQPQVSRSTMGQQFNPMQQQQQQVSQSTMPQQFNPMQQQMQFQQMQQQMSSMTLGGSSQMVGSQMGGLHHPPHQTAVGGRAWGGAATGHTLSSSLWQ